MELGGNITVSCAKTGYNATVDFLTKPFYGGKKHRIAGNIYAPNEKKPFCVLDGEWNGTVWAKYNTGVSVIYGFLFIKITFNCVHLKCVYHKIINVYHLLCWIS